MQESNSSIMLRKVGRGLNVCLKLFIIVIIAFPFYWMVSTSLKDYTEALQFPPTLFPIAFTGKTTPMYLRSYPSRCTSGTP